INKATRDLTLDKDALTLTLGALTGTVTGTTSTDLDKSAVITYTSANPALATVNRQGAITAVGNGTVNITVAIAAKSNYNEVSKTCAVTAVVKPVTAVTVTGGADAELTATVKDTTITVSGMMTAGQDLVITPTNATGVTGSAVTIAAVDAAKLTAGGSYVATITTGAKTVTYTIITSSVKLIPANVKLPETAPVVAAAGEGVAEADRTNVNNALNNASTKLDGLVAAVGNAIDQAVKLLAEKKAELDAAFAGGYEAKVEVFPKITVTGHTSNGATGSLTLDIAPFMQISATGTGHADVELQAATQVDNTNLTAPVLVQIAKGSMTLPASNLFAKHQLAGGKFEYLPVTYDGVTQVYSWWTTSFSSFELYSDTRSATITYTFEDGTTKVVTYTPADIGTSLPSDVKSGNTFSGWTINGVTYTQLTDAALTAISGSHAATGNFTPINNNSSSSGSVAPKGETVKNPDGSTTTTITDKKTGTVTATTKFPDGSKSVVETKKDGTVATTDTRKDGLKAETVTTPEGVTTATVTVPRNVGSTQVSLPVKDAKPGTIAVLIKADGTKEIIKKSVAKDGKVTFPIDASAKIEIIDNSKSFEDVKESDWFAASVAFASAHELFSGTGEKIFDPTADMNRGMLITVMHRLENLPKGGDVNFDDVPAGAYYAEAAAWAKEAKIVTGTGAGLDPDANVTRESLAVMLYRYAKVEKSTGDLTKFVDGDKISSWAADAMSWAVQAGILQGAGGALNPAGNATRAEVAAMMQRFVEFTVK
ncbi:MAG: S-layer homology domain-containing protein, partial [Oscillospiraceae bacterium]